MKGLSIMKNPDSIFKEFTNQYKVNKTLRFRLIPQGDTE